MRRRSGIGEPVRVKHSLGTLEVVVCALALLALATACDGERSDYVAANEAIIKDLPRFPDAERVSRDVEGIHDRDCSDDADCPVVAWATHERYALPPGTTAAQVLEFYVNNLSPDWTVVDTEEISLREVVPRGAPEPPVVMTGDYRIELRRDLAFVGITTCVSSSCDSGELLIDVNYRYYAP
jgi:hypothetical protein